MSVPAALPGVLVLGTGAMATAVSILSARAGYPVIAWGRNEEHVEWLLEDVREACGGQVRIERSFSLSPAPWEAELLHGSVIVIPAVPWGDPLRSVLGPLRGLDPRSACVLDVANPYEATPMGPKLAMYVPGGSAAALTAEALPPQVPHVHALTHLRVDALLTAAEVGVPLPFTSTGDPGPGERPALALLLAMGFVPVRVGGIRDSALVEAGGPWESAAGRDGLGLRSLDQARVAGLID